jgi:hypothetical protein
VGEVEGEVFFGRCGEIDDPGLAGAAFYFAVVGSVVEKEAAVFHGFSTGSL